MAAYTHIDETGAGLHIGRKASDKVGLYGVTPVVQPANADQAVLADSSGGTADNTIAAVTAAATITDSSGGTDPGDDTIALVVGSQRSGYVYYQNIATASTTNAATQLDLNGISPPAAMAAPLNPDVPRNLKITVTDGDASISAFQIDVVGIAQDGTTVNEQFVFAGGLVQTGSKIYAKLTSITVTSMTGSAAADTLDAGWDTKIGVPLPVGSTSYSTTKLVSAGTEEASAGDDAANGSVIPTTAPNNTNDYEIWFEYLDPVNASVTAAIAQLAAKQNTTSTAVTAAMNNFADLAAKINTFRQDLIDVGIIKGAA